LRAEEIAGEPISSTANLTKKSPRKNMEGFSEETGMVSLTLVDGRLPIAGRLIHHVETYFSQMWVTLG
jgi:hypothetical protein